MDMQIGRGSAHGKIILFGEHAVVYGRPALAAPVLQVVAEAIVEVGAPGAGLVIWATDLGERVAVQDAPADEPLAVAARLALAHLGLANPDWHVAVHSTIPVASGMGSGAAVTAALVRALADAAAKDQAAGVSQFIDPSSRRPILGPLPPADVSALVYEVEKLHHGTPSGIDNTVIAYDHPVYYVRGQAPQPFDIGLPFTLVIADTGIRSPTRVAVASVRASWQAEPARFETRFDRVGAIVESARAAITAGESEQLGPLMDENHVLLQQIGVSCPELDALVTAARSAGALGAKLSGAGRGGNMIALVTAATIAQVVVALRTAGAARVLVSEMR